jgi:hypothetical protein
VKPCGGYDMDALVKIFPDNACPVEHWGYIFRGKVRVEYTAGTGRTCLKFPDE